MSGKAGLRQERRILRALAGRGHVVIMNDLTNCIRYGDLTVAGHPTPAILEVKSSDVDTPRVRRQFAKAQEVAEYLRSDVSPNWQGSGWTIVRRSLQLAERNHRRRLVRLIETARSAGHSISWPEPGLCYCCFGRSSVRDVVENLRPRFKQPPIAYPLFPADSHPSYYYPLTLSIADSEAWWSVVSGEISVVVLINPERIRALGRSMGLAITQLNEPDWLWAITAENDDGSLGPLNISHQFFGRVAGEFLSLQWFVEEAAARFREGPAASGLEAGTDGRPNLGLQPTAAGAILSRRG